MTPAEEAYPRALQQRAATLRRAWSGARAAEGLLLGMGVFLGLFGLAILEGEPTRSLAALVSASVVAALVGLSWVSTQRRSTAQLVDLVAGRLEEETLRAAHDTLARGEENPMVALAARRALERATLSAQKACLQGELWWFLAAPLVGAVLLTQALSVQGARQATLASGAAAFAAGGKSAQQAARDLMELSSEAAFDPTQVQAALSLAREAGQLETAGPEEVEDWLDRARELASELRHAEQDATALEEAIRAVEAGQMAEEARRDTAEARPNGRESEVAGVGGPGSSTDGGGEGDQPSPGEGTMRGGPDGATPSEDPTRAPADRPLAAAQAGLEGCAPRDVALVQRFLSSLDDLSNRD